MAHQGEVRHYYRRTYGALGGGAPLDRHPALHLLPRTVASLPPSPDPLDPTVRRRPLAPSPPYAAPARRRRRRRRCGPALPRRRRPDPRGTPPPPPPRPPNEIGRALLSSPPPSDERGPPPALAAAGERNPDVPTPRLPLPSSATGHLRSSRRPKDGAVTLAATSRRLFLRVASGCSPSTAAWGEPLFLASMLRVHVTVPCSSLVQAASYTDQWMLDRRIYVDVS